MRQLPTENYAVHVIFHWLTFALNSMAKPKKSVREEEEADGDSDGAPETVSLARGREEALKSHKMATIEARRYRKLCEGRSAPINER